jgi:hypothetical protein
MILKSISRKSSVKNLIKYIFKEQKDYWEQKTTSKSKWYVPGIKLTAKDIKHLEQEKEDAKLLQQLKAFKGTVQEFIQTRLLAKAQKEQPFIIKHNIRARSIEGFCREYAENESRRLYHRSDAVSSYHVILSWSPKDAAHLTDAILKDIANEYIRLRGNNCLVIGTKHTEGVGHIHLHLAVSGTHINGKSSRQSKAEFQKIKEQLQEFQRTKYPFLSNSLPRHGKGNEIEKGVEKKYKNERRSSEKESLLRCLDEVYATSTSREHFISQLEARGHCPYYRNGKFQGIKFEGEEGRKHRVYRYGYSEEKLLLLDMQKAKEEKQLTELQALRAPRAKERSILIRKSDAEIKEPALIDPREFEKDALQELEHLRNSDSKDMDMETSNEDDLSHSQSDRDEEDADEVIDNEPDTKNSSDTDDTDDTE